MTRSDNPLGLIARYIPFYPLDGTIKPIQPVIPFPDVDDKKKAQQREHASVQDRDLREINFIIGSQIQLRWSFRKKSVRINSFLPMKIDLTQKLMD